MKTLVEQIVNRVMATLKESRGERMANPPQSGETVDLGYQEKIDLAKQILDYGDFPIYSAEAPYESISTVNNAEWLGDVLKDIFVGPVGALPRDGEMPVFKLQDNSSKKSYLIDLSE